MRVDLKPKSLEPFLILAGWKESALSEAEKGAEEAINIAGWLCWKKEGGKNPALQALCAQAIDNGSAKSIITAQEIAIDYPQLVARITPLGLEWSVDIKNRWCLIFHSEPPVPRYW